MEKKSIGKLQRFGNRYTDGLVSLCGIAVNVAVMACFFDFYYDLNDDVMMKDIMSGVYTGVPDGHNMQTLYPLGALISFMYRLCGEIPWYGLFLFLCQFGCFWLFGTRLMTVLAAGWGKEQTKQGLRPLWRAAVVLLTTLLMWGMVLTHLLHIQYTITCAMLSSTAIFWFYTTPEKDTAREFVLQNLPAVLLVLTAYMLRSEMLLLTLPFIGLAGLFRWAFCPKSFSSENLLRYGGIACAIAVGMLLLWGMDACAYGSPQWRDFREFFGARTTVYDFYPEMITEEQYSGLLEETGVSDTQQALLKSYNFGLDGQMDTELMRAVAESAQEHIGAQKDWGAIFREQLGEYRYRLCHAEDAPYNLLLFWLYAASLLLCLYGRRIEILWQLLLLAVTRTAVWMFILMRGRSPERITHSLYLTELAFLAGFLLWHLYREERQQKLPAGICRAGAGILGAVLLLNCRDAVLQTMQEQEYRMSVCAEADAIDTYCRAHPDNFYMEEVYSTVSFSQKIWGNPCTEYANYDIMGGWMCGSPLYEEKLQRAGISSVEEALLEREDVFLLVSDAEAESGLTWLTDFYASKGTPVCVMERDRIGAHYGVYEIRR